MTASTAPHKRKTTFLLAASLAALTFAGMAPLASAHECHVELGDENEEDCRKKCVDGEYHDHRVGHHHENGLGEDEDHAHYECTSRGGQTPPPECPLPRVLGVCIVGGSLIDVAELRIVW